MDKADQVPTDVEGMCRLLRSEARFHAYQNEEYAKEHFCWKAADMLESLSRNARVTIQTCSKCGRGVMDCDECTEDDARCPFKDGDKGLLCQETLTFVLDGTAPETSTVATNE